MQNKIFEVSPFWSWLSFFNIKRCALLALIFFLVFEMVARVSPIIWGKHVHRPYAVSYAPCQESCDYQGKKVQWYSNERGARGSLYASQNVQIATFGSSTTSNSLVSQKFTWPEQLKGGENSDIHVDNFGKDGAGNKEIESILKHLISQGAKYDAILIMDHFSHEERKVSDKIAFSDWGKHSSKLPLKTPELLFNALLDSAKNLVKSNSLLLALSEQILKRRSANSDDGQYPHPDPLDHKNRESRNAGLVQFVDLPEEAVTTEKVQYIQTRMKTLIQLAKQMTDKVYFVIQPVAFDENELPGVAQNWYSLYPASEVEAIYLSNKTVATRIRNVQQVIADFAKQNNIATIDLDQYLRPKLQERDDLFFDKWHLSPQGNEVAGEFIAAQLKQEHIINHNEN